MGATEEVAFLRASMGPIAVALRSEGRRKDCVCYAEARQVYMEMNCKVGGVVMMKEDGGEEKKRRRKEV